MILTRPHPYAHLLRSRNEWQPCDLFLRAADELDVGVDDVVRLTREAKRLQAENDKLRAAVDDLMGYGRG